MLLILSRQSQALGALPAREKDCLGGQNGPVSNKRSGRRQPYREKKAAPTGPGGNYIRFHPGGKSGVRRRQKRVRNSRLHTKTAGDLPEYVFYLRIM